MMTTTRIFIAHCGAFECGKENRRSLNREPRYHRIRDRDFVNIASLQLGKEVVDLHWMRLGDERVEKQKNRCFARTSRQRRSQSRNRSRIPRRDIAAREDRTFLSMCGPHFCSMKIIEDVRKYAAEQGSRRERNVEKGSKRKVPRIDGEGQRGLREGVIFSCFCPRHKRWKSF